MRTVMTFLMVVASGCSGDPSYGGRSADDWAAAIVAGSPQERAAAAEAFANAPPHRFDHIRPLLVATSDLDTNVRRSADSAVAKLTPDATKALIQALSDSSAIVRRSATTALGRISGGAKQSVPALVRAMRDPDDSVRTSAVISLGRLGSGAYEAVEVIRTLAQNPGPLRPAALMALPNIDTESRSLLSIYRPAVSDSSAAVRAAAVWQLPAAVGDVSFELVPILANALHDPERRVQLAGLRTLAWMSERDSTALYIVDSMKRSADSTLRRVADSALTALQVQRSRKIRP